MKTFSHGLVAGILVATAVKVALAATAFAPSAVQVTGRSDTLTRYQNDEVICYESRIGLSCIPVTP